MQDEKHIEAERANTVLRMAMQLADNYAIAHCTHWGAHTRGEPQDDQRRLLLRADAARTALDIYLTAHLRPAPAAQQAIEQLAAQQKPIPPEAAKVLRENLWELMAREGAAQQAPATTADTLPIASLNVDDDGNVLSAYLYAPGLPAGSHDVWAGPVQAQAGWLPIASAPKDGRKLMLAYRNRSDKARTVLAYWLTDEEAAATDEDGVGLEGGWYECIDNWPDYTQIAIHEGEPTHWQPLPPAPQQQGGRPALSGGKE